MKLEVQFTIVIVKRIHHVLITMYMSNINESCDK